MKAHAQGYTAGSRLTITCECVEECSKTQKEEHMKTARKIFEGFYKDN